MRKRILIIGAGVAGRDVLKEIKANGDIDLKIVGFIDDDPAKMNKSISGVRVLGNRKNLKFLIKKLKIKRVIISIPSAEGQRISEYLQICAASKVDVRIVPRVKEIIEGRAHLSTLRKARVEDLLGRPVVKADVGMLKHFFKNKKVLVTGAAGSIGSELSRQISAYRPKKLGLLDWWENGIFYLKNELSRDFPKENIEYYLGNIQDRKKILEILQKLKPDYVFHAAAYKHVPLMEEFPEEAVKNNVFGTNNLMRESLKMRVKKFVQVSTDKAANPKNVMGATKLIAEGLAKLYSRKNKTEFVTVRFGNVLDTLGSVVQVFREQIEQGGPITITDKRMTRYFMTVPEAAQLILKATALGESGQLFILDMGDPVKIIDLAENMVRLSGYVPGEDIKIVFTGKRPGEKLREKLFHKKEKPIATKLEKIYISESLGIDIEKLQRTIRDLIRLAEESNRMGIRKELAKIIKGFPVDS